MGHNHALLGKLGGYLFKFPADVFVREAVKTVASHPGVIIFGWKPESIVYPGVSSMKRGIETRNLSSVREDGLRFVPVVLPNNFQAEYTGDPHLRVTAIARGIDCESNPIRLNIDWDGKWEFGDDAMAKHLVITETV